MSKVIATRSELLAGRSQEAVARRGHALLEQKRAAASDRIRDAREAAYQQILGDVRAELGVIRDRGDYPEILAGLIAEARDMLPACVTVRVDPADEALARRLLHGEDELRVEPVLRSDGGAEVADGAGATAINTVEARLAAAEPVLRALIGGLLQDDPAGRAEQAREAEVGSASPDTATAIGAASPTRSTSPGTSVADSPDTSSSESASRFFAAATGLPPKPATARRITKGPAKTSRPHSSQPD